MLNILPGGYEMRARRIASQCVPLDFPGCQKHWMAEDFATSVNEERLVQIVTVRNRLRWHERWLECYRESQMPFVTTTEAGVPIQGPSATLIYDDWYPALRTDTLRRSKLATAMLLGIPLVLGRRDDGRVFAMRDSCPHRGIPLSVGWFDGKRVTCRYHGWEFEPCSGQCATDSLADQPRSRWMRRRSMRPRFPARSAMGMRGCMCRGREAEDARRRGAAAGARS